MHNQILKAESDSELIQTGEEASSNFTAQVEVTWKYYTLEKENRIEDDGFERWPEQFKERVTLAGWSTTKQLHQLKLLMERTALKVFCMLPDMN